jgi:hypothetical protein
MAQQLQAGNYQQIRLILADGWREYYEQPVHGSANCVVLSKDNSTRCC